MLRLLLLVVCVITSLKLSRLDLTVFWKEEKEVLKTVLFEVVDIVGLPDCCLCLLENSIASNSSMACETKDSKIETLGGKPFLAAISIVRCLDA